MGLGLLLLESYGKENTIITEKPKITYFKKVYKRYENFSFEYFLYRTILIIVILIPYY